MRLAIEATSSTFNARITSVQGIAKARAESRQGRGGRAKGRVLMLQIPEMALSIHLLRMRKQRLR